MSRAWAALVAALLAAGLALGLAASAGAGPEAPGVAGRGPGGLGVLFTWLGEAGRASSSIEPTGWLSREAATVVLAAPAASELDAEEVAALRRFVQGGGTLVYLASRELPQPALHRWLGLQPGATPPTGPRATARVLVPGGPLAGVDALEVHGERQVRLEVAGAVAVAEWGALWWWACGEGEVWVGAGTDLAENASLDRAGNAHFWSALAARGPLVFLERHHLRGAGPRTPAGLAVAGLQLGLLALAFAAARGSRLGPPREPPPAVHRRALEYVEAMARLTRRAGAGPRLVPALQAQGLALAGCPASLGWAAAVARVSAGDPRAGEALAALGAAGDFLTASRALARLERRLRPMG